MITKTIELPEQVAKECGENITYKILKAYIMKQSHKKIEDKYYNKEKENYWPFNWALEAINFLQRWN